MTIASSLIPEFDQEMGTTRRLLERVPTAQARWTPHPRSFALGHLAQLISWMPGWITSSVSQDSLDLAGAPGYSFEATETLLAGFDQNVRGARAALEAVSDAAFAGTWSLRRGERVLLTMPKAAIVRMHLSHLVHHRGQLTVYLRLLDVPIPPIYGPTADERM